MLLKGTTSWLACLDQSALTEANLKSGHCKSGPSPAPGAEFGMPDGKCRGGQDASNQITRDRAWFGWPITKKKPWQWHHLARLRAQYLPLAINQEARMRTNRQQANRSSYSTVSASSTNWTTLDAVNAMAWQSLESCCQHYVRGAP